MASRVEITFDEGVVELPLEPAQAVVAAAKAKPLKLPPGKINVLITHAKRLRALNRRYAGEDRATDVLSFDYRQPSPLPAELREGVLGEIVISREHISRQAEAAKTSAATELALLVLHGLLHLSGYDHQNAKDSRELDRLQAELMAAAGLTYRDFKWQH